MIRILILITILQIFILSEIYCQNILCNNCPFEINNKNKAPVPAIKYYNKLPSKQEQFYNDWTPGKIVYKNGKISDSILIRYNSWTDELLWLRISDYKQGVVIKDLVKEFFFYSKNNTPSMHFFNTQKNYRQLPVNCYIEALNKGNTQLLCFRKMTYIKGNNLFSNNYQYYLKRDSVIEKVNLNKKSILSNFPVSERDKLKAILKKEKIRPGNEESIINLIIRYNQINTEVI